MVKSEFEDYSEIKEDCEQYRDLARRYLALDLSDPNLCFEVKKDAWALAQRWSDIARMMWNKAEEELKFITRFEKYGVVSN